MATMDNLVAISTAVALQEAESKSRIAWWAPEDGNTGCPEDEQDGRSCRLVSVLVSAGRLPVNHHGLPVLPVHSFTVRRDFK